jgi:hypothetical protein
MEIDGQKSSRCVLELTMYIAHRFNCLTCAIESPHPGHSHSSKSGGVQSPHGGHSHSCFHVYVNQRHHVPLSRSVEEIRLGKD